MDSRDVASTLRQKLRGPKRRGGWEERRPGSRYAWAGVGGRGRQARLEGFLATLPPVNATCDVVIALWLLSKEPGDRVSVGLGTWLGQPWGKGGDAVYPS